MCVCVCVRACVCVFARVRVCECVFAFGFMCVSEISITRFFYIGLSSGGRDSGGRGEKGAKMVCERIYE